MTKRKRCLLSFAISVFISATINTNALALNPDETIIAVQKRYDATTSLKARFIQKSYLKVMGQSQVAEGSVLIKKPGRMKWNYSAPDPQLLISDEDFLWLYLPDDKQATRMKIESVYSSNTPALFLAGKGKLTRSFNVGQVLEQETTYKITLFPKEEEQNIDHLVLFADKKNFQILGSSVYDKLGNHTEMRFTDIKVNPTLNDNLFLFKAPAGVEIIDFSEQQ
ncbi:MAG: outer membrane lipoprotein chaperone LolA [Candidatus Nitronauta litoralis]|uniref:Outer-membrane lipoprotein carrier protein n=1 Tax=Candidatus Nitronauta litoralis TaxID=2705533 RepID=A0A7T0BXE6_9BACT|nr:MAG: outer membrane lipoprotein chaperone LolA [Candidatus Nitronauta litoralis]